MSLYWKCPQVQEDDGDGDSQCKFDEILFFFEARWHFGPALWFIYFCIDMYTYRNIGVQARGVYCSCKSADCFSFSFLFFFLFFFLRMCADVTDEPRRKRN